MIKTKTNQLFTARELAGVIDIYHPNNLSNPKYDDYGEYRWDPYAWRPDSNPTEMGAWRFWEYSMDEDERKAVYASRYASGLYAEESMNVLIQADANDTVRDICKKCVLEGYRMALVSCGINAAQSDCYDAMQRELTVSVLKP